MTDTKEAIDITKVVIPKGLRLRNDDRGFIARSMAAKSRDEKLKASQPEEFVLDLHKRLMAFLWNVPTFEEAVALTNAMHPGITQGTSCIDIITGNQVERDGNTRIDWASAQVYLGSHNGSRLEVDVDGKPVKFWAPVTSYHRNSVVVSHQMDHAMSNVGKQEDRAKQVLDLGHYCRIIYVPEGQLATDLTEYADFNKRCFDAADKLERQITRQLMAIKTAEQLRDMLPEAFELLYTAYPDRFVPKNANLPAINAEQSAAAIKKALEDYPDMEVA